MARHLGDSFLDFVENTRLGSALFQLARLGFFALAILVVSKVASKQFLSFSLADVLFMAITAVVFLLIFWRWEIGIALVLCTTSFIAYYDVMPTLSLYHFVPEIKILEQLRLQLGQGIILYLLAIFFLSLEARNAKERLSTPLTPAVIVFLLVIFAAAIVGVTFYEVDLPRMVETSRSYSFYLMFFVTLLCVKGRRELNLLLGITYVMALVVSLLMFVQFGLGDRAKVFLGHSIRVESFGAFAGRILPPGVELIWLTIPFVIARIPLLHGASKKFMVGSLTILLGGLLLTFTRSVWLGVILAMITMAILGRGAIRQGVLRMFVALGALVALLLVVLSLLSNERENYATPYIQRFASIFHPETYAQGTSAEARMVEIRAAWPVIEKHPWLGIGVGGNYRYVEDWSDPTQEHFRLPVSYIHDAYVLLLTHTGILGLGTCLVMYITFFVRARKIYYRLERPEDKGLVLSAIGAIASVMLASIMQPSLWYPPAVPLIAMIFGIVELLRYLADAEARQSEKAMAWLPAARVRGRVADLSGAAISAPPAAPRPARGPWRPGSPARASRSTLRASPRRAST